VVATVVPGVTLGELARNLCDVKKANAPAPGYALSGGPGPLSQPTVAAASGAARGTGKIRPAARTRKNFGQMAKVLALRGNSGSLRGPGKI